MVESAGGTKKRNKNQANFMLEGSAGKCGILILHFEKLQKTPDTSQ